jgi:ankyrin repeat protein
MLSINKLIILGQYLDYGLSEKGICAGFSGMWIQSVLAEDIDSFYKRLSIIKKYACGDNICEDFDELIDEINQIKTKIKAKQSINDRELELLEIPVFYEGMHLYLLTMYFQDWFGQFTNQYEVEAIYDLVKPQKLAHQPLHTVYKQLLAFDKQSLLNYLDDLKTILENYPCPLPIRMDSDGHTICLKYDLLSKKWHFIDTSKDLTVSKETILGKKKQSFHRQLNTEELVKYIYRAFDDKGTTTLFTTQIFAGKGNPLLEEQFVKLNHKNQEIIRNKINSPNARHITLLWLAAERGDLALVEESLKAQVDINQADDKGVTPLFIACQTNQLSVVNYLLKHGADPNKTMVNGQSPLQAACFTGNKEIIRALLNQGAKINHRDNTDKTALYVACLFKKEEVAIELLQNDANIHLANNKGVTPLQQASRLGSELLVKELLNRQAPLNLADNEGRTALHWACALEYQVCVRLLLEKGASVDQADNQGKTPRQLILQLPNDSKNKLSLLKLVSNRNPYNSIKTIQQMVSTLNDNIEHKKAGRENWFESNTDTKVAKLNAISNWLTKRVTLNEQSQQVLLALIRDVCKEKRNCLGFFQPHSLGEFNYMVEKFNSTVTDNKLIIPDEISFTSTQLRGLNDDFNGVAVDNLIQSSYEHHYVL